MALETRMISTRITLMFADFNGRPRQQYALCYNEHTGSLVSDKGRNIAKIDYDRFSNPIRIQFTNGNVTKYVYSAAGEKLKVIYQTAVPNISVAIGSTRELTASQVQYTDSIDYILGGSLTLRNGRIDQYQFEEGYCQAEVYSSTIDKFAFCYYDQDHLGNIRHEMAHSKDYLDGTMNENPWGTKTYSEAFAMHVENVIRVEQNSIVGNNKYPIRVFYGTDNMRGAYVNRDNYSSVFFRTNSLANPLPKGGKYQTLKPKEGYVYTNR